MRGARRGAYRLPTPAAALLVSAAAFGCAESASRLEVAPDARRLVAACEDAWLRRPRASAEDRGREALLAAAAERDPQARRRLWLALEARGRDPLVRRIASSLLATEPDAWLEELERERSENRKAAVAQGLSDLVQSAVQLNPIGVVAGLGRAVAGGFGLGGTDLFERAWLAYAALLERRSGAGALGARRPLFESRLARRRGEIALREERLARIHASRGESFAAALHLHAARVARPGAGTETEASEPSDRRRATAGPPRRSEVSALERVWLLPKESGGAEAARDLLRRRLATARRERARERRKYLIAGEAATRDPLAERSEAARGLRRSAFGPLRVLWAPLAFVGRVLWAPLADPIDDRAVERARFALRRFEEGRALLGEHPSGSGRQESEATQSETTGESEFPLRLAADLVGLDPSAAAGRTFRWDEDGQTLLVSGGRRLALPAHAVGELVRRIREHRWRVAATGRSPERTAQRGLPVEWGLGVGPGGLRLLPRLPGERLQARIARYVSD